MTSPRIIEARRKLAKSKKWGAAAEQGILSGSFDNGELIKQFLTKEKTK